MFNAQEIWFDRYNGGFQQHDVVRACFGLKSNATTTQRFISELLAQVYNYLHLEKGYSYSLTRIDQQLVKFPGERLNGPFGIHLSDSGVKQATQFKDFLLNYPQENTIEQLAEVVSSLYVSNKEFPYGFGNTKELRKYIASAFFYYFTFVTKEPIRNVSDKQFYPILDKRLKIMGEPARAFLNHYYDKKVLILATLTSSFLPDLQKIILQLWQELHFPSQNNCKPGESFHCLGLFKAPEIEHRTVRDEQDPADVFVLMTQM